MTIASPSVPALTPGQHQFKCDVHPAMTGTLIAGP